MRERISTMKALLLIGHGSKREEANDEITGFTDELGKLASDKFQITKCAFLEFTEPTIEMQLNDIIAFGCKEVVVFPYFISLGKHVLNDIPEKISVYKNKYPDVKFLISGHLGSIPTLKKLISNFL